MPLVPSSLALDPIYHISSDEGYTTDHMNPQSTTFVSADISTSELEEITQTFHVDMVSDHVFNGTSSPIPSSFSNINTARSCDSASNPIVCGVFIVDERVQYRPSQHNDGLEPTFKNAAVLGTVVLGRFNYSGEELRRCIQSQLPSVPQKFNFLTKEGWPILRNQETKVNTSNIINNNNIITIRKAFDKPRVGIINTNGECLGFVFVEYSWTLQSLRSTIEEQLKELVTRGQKFDYKFIEKNGWPVASNQESLLTVLDIIINHNICIQSSNFVANNPRLPPNLETPQEKPNYALPAPQFNIISDEPDLSSTKENLSFFKPIKKGGLSLSFRQTTKRKQEKVSEIKIKSRTSKGDSRKLVMLSYARQEAAFHALDLKKKLVDCGFSVYLDVHEIQTGSDWQDSLNEAVHGCEVFVPLVTPMYGKTQWTNREVKLADLLNKYIVPINFLDYWPPECLAIQFATTQYIPWRPALSEHQSVEKNTPDIKEWGEIYVQKVTALLAEQIKLYSKKVPELQQSKQKAKALAISENENNNKPLIVISAHPHQKALVNQIKAAFDEEEFKVWCSISLPDGDLADEEALVNEMLTPTQLPTIDEGQETAFSDVYKDFENYKDIARKIVESKRPVSLPIGSDRPVVNDSGYPKKCLVRTFSTTSEGSHFSSLTADKMGQLKTFQEQTRSAKVVIVVTSKAYFSSTTSQQHVYYCEHRKKMILVKSEICSVPSWFSMLTVNNFTINAKHPRFTELLKAHVKRILNPLSKTPDDDMHESKMQYLISFMKTNLSVCETCIYVVGSAQLQNPRSEEICREIGNELAKVKNVQVVTSGFYGAGDIVAKSFFETKKKNDTDENKSSLENEQCKAPVVHIVPMKDSEDFSSKCRQNEDGTFAQVPYGKTIFLGESVKERETAVARLLDTCILIEGGPGSAHEIEEFIWNDHFVIPVTSTGGAASGLYGVPQKIFDAPRGVSEKEWALLSDAEASPIEVAKAVVGIVVALKKEIAKHKLSRHEMEKKSKIKPKSSMRMSKKKIALDKKKVDIAAANANNQEIEEPNSPEKVLPVIEPIDGDKKDGEKSSKRKWKGLNKLITFSRNC